MSETPMSEMPDVVTLITADHREVERLFEQLRDDTESRAQTVLQLRAMLLAHAEAEEGVVYPALKPEMEDQESDETNGDVIDEAYDEHEEAEQLMEELAATDPNSEEFDSVLMDLMESVNHHVEEEENELLPQLREILSDEDMQMVTREFYRIRLEILEQEGGESLGIPPLAYDPVGAMQQEVDLRSNDRETAS